MMRILLLSLLLLALLPLAVAATDDEEAAKAKLTPPMEWVLPPVKPLRVLEVRGLWFDMYGIDAALAHLGGAAISESWHSPSGLRYYPGGYEGLLAHHLVVVGNCNAGAFTPVQRKTLQEYVANGGAVLFLGGYYAFGKEYAGTAFAEMCPVTFTANDLVGAPEGQVLTPGKQASTTLKALPWADAPRVYWMHNVTPKPEAEVWLTAGEKPLLITGRYGKGRVAVFAGSVMGVPRAGQQAFWAWQGWPQVLAQTIAWLAESPAPRTLSADGRADLRARFLGVGAKKLATLAPELRRAIPLCGDAETARLLLQACAFLDGDPSLDLIDELAAHTLSYVDGTFAEVGGMLVSSGQAGKISLGLRVLGKAKAPGAQALLLEALDSGELPVDEEPGEMMLDDGVKMVEDPEIRSYAIRLGALEGLGWLGDLAAIPALRAYLAAHRLPGQAPEELTAGDELTQEAAIAALRCGDADAAGKAVDAVLQCRYTFIRMSITLDQPIFNAWDEQAKLRKARISRMLGRAQVRYRLLAGKFTDLPPAVLPALATRLAAETDPRVMPLAFAAFSRTAPPTAIDTLRKGALPAVREIVDRFAQ